MGDSRAERDLLADQILQIEHKALYEAIKNAPEILFVTSAGNLGNAANGKAIPSLFDLPNIIRAGAVDHKGHPVLNARNTVIDIYALGFNVPAKTVEGLEVRSMGTSISCAQVTNVVAKMLAVNKELTPIQIKSLILETGTPCEKKQSIMVIHPQRAVDAAKQSSDR